jgi:hypothetical protein
MSNQNQPEEFASHRFFKVLNLLKKNEKMPCFYLNYLNFYVLGAVKVVAELI